MTTLTIDVNYDKTNKFFWFFLSHTDPTDQVTWVSTINDGGLIQFVNDGQLRLSNDDDGKARSKTFTFDAVRVVLGHTLTGFPSLQCGSDTKSFDLGSIPFPTITSGKTAIVPCSWCQCTKMAADGKALSFQDPKLGLTNTKSDTSIGIDASSWAHCKCKSGH